MPVRVPTDDTSPLPDLWPTLLDHTRSKSTDESPLSSSLTTIRTTLTSLKCEADLNTANPQKVSYNKYCCESTSPWGSGLAICPRVVSQELDLLHVACVRAVAPAPSIWCYSTRLVSALVGVPGHEEVSYLH